MYGIIAGARVKFMDEDACKGSVKCPITSGMTYTYTDSIFCRKEYPEVSSFFLCHSREQSSVLPSVVVFCKYLY